MPGLYQSCPGSYPGLKCLTRVSSTHERCVAGAGGPCTSAGLAHARGPPGHPHPGWIFSPAEITTNTEQENVPYAILTAFHKLSFIYLLKFNMFLGDGGRELSALL